MWKNYIGLLLENKYKREAKRVMYLKTKDKKCLQFILLKDQIKLSKQEYSKR